MAKASDINYIVYEPFEKLEDGKLCIDDIVKSKNPIHELVYAYTHSMLKVKRKLATKPESIDAYELLFDKDKCLVTVKAHEDSEPITGIACVKCPDCKEDMILQKKPPYFKGKGAPFIYMCENRDNIPSCNATASAKYDGTLLRPPADEDTRKARKNAKEKFDAMWHSMEAVKGLGDWNTKDNKKIVSDAQTRAFRWLAHALGRVGENPSFSNLDLGTLAKVVALCEKANPDMVYSLGENSDKAKDYQKAFK